MSVKMVRFIALVTVMAAVTCALTLIHLYNIPATGGYIHPGDIGANFAALAFGPWFGGLIAGVGMAIADLILGGVNFAPGTLIVHGLQAIVVGLLSRRVRKPWMMFLAAVLGSTIVVAGYFAYEVWILGFDQLVAAQEAFPWNVIQGAVGLVGVPVYLLVVRAYPPLLRWTKQD